MPGGRASAMPVGIIRRSPGASVKASRQRRSYPASPARVRAGGRAPGRSRRTGSSRSTAAITRRNITEPPGRPPVSDQPGSVMKRMVPEAPPVPLRDVWRRFWPYARPQRKWLAIVLGLVIVGPLLDTATIWLFKLVIDDVLVPKDFGMFLPLAGAYLGLTILRGGLGFLEDWLSAWTTERFVLSLRVIFFSHVQRLSLDALERRQLGDVLSRMSGDVAAIESFVLSGVVGGVAYITRLLFFAGALFFIDWRLALVAIMVAPIFGYTSRLISRSIKRASREVRRSAGSIGAIAEESLANTQLVQAYGGQTR